MGVKGLQRYTEECCTDVCYSVSFSELAERHRKDHPGIESVLVADGLSVLAELCRGPEHLFGGQWLEIHAKLKWVVDKFRGIGIKLVFFFDGSTLPSSKCNVWINRRIEKFKSYGSIFKDINKTLQWKSMCQIKLTSLGTFMRFILKYSLNIEVYSSIGDADAEIAAYAKENEAVFGILSQDTDFLIFDTKTYLSLKYLNMKDMTTKTYDRQALLSKLSLHSTQMPLLSCLLGNDVIDRRSLRTFHSNVCPSIFNVFDEEIFNDVSVLIPAVSSIIRENRWSEDLCNINECSEIAKIAFGSRNMCQLLRDGLSWYEMKAYPLNEMNIVWRKHVMVENIPYVFSVWECLEYKCSAQIEDSTNTSNLPVDVVYRDIRRRCYFIILSGKSDAVVKEWSAHPKNEDFVIRRQPAHISPLPIYTIGELLNLKDLWSDDPKFKDARMQYFLKCLGTQLSPCRLNTVPSQYVILTCVLNYLLMKTPQILEEWEILAFILTAVRMQGIQLNNVLSIKITHVEPRAIYLATLVLHGVKMVGMALSTCGYPFPITICFPWQFFDGKLFHQIYGMAKRNPDINGLCSNLKEAVEVSRILWVVTFGTPLQKEKKQQIN